MLLLALFRICISLSQLRAIRDTHASYAYYLVKRPPQFADLAAMGPNNKPSQGSSFFNIRRKSVPKNSISNEQISADRVISSPMTESEHIIEALSRPTPRPRSSWYSQPSISGNIIPTTPLSIPVPRVPEQYLKMSGSQDAVVNGLSHAALVTQIDHQRDTRDSWEDESPGGTRQNSDTHYIKPRQHTAVSEYLQNRSWTQTKPRATVSGAFIEEYPEPSSPPPPIPSNRPLSMLRPYDRRDLRRDSIDSDSDPIEPADQPQSRRGSLLQQASRRASSIKTTWPYSMLIKAQPRDDSLLSPISHFSTRQAPVSATPRKPYASFTEPFSAMPYNATRQGAAPVPIRSIEFQISADSHSPEPNAALKRGLTKHYGKGVAPRASARSNVVPSSYHTSAYELQPPYPITAVSGLLLGSNSKAREYSNQGYWLFIGTMRGPTPDGVKMIDEMMAKSLSSKKGGTEKGLKEIRKVLRHEKRSVIEWVENYVRKRFGVEV